MTSRKDNAALLRQEVQELTQLLRDAPEWDGLRSALASRGLGPSEVLLISFGEDETEGEYGAFLKVMDRRVFEYERSTVAGAARVFTLWREVGATESRGKYPTLVEGLRMLSQGRDE